MPAIPLDRLLREPPGPRRVQLALRNRGLHQAHVALECNCDQSTVSRVVAGLLTSELHQRIRQTVISLTGLDEHWLFEPVGQAGSQRKAS